MEIGDRLELVVEKAKVNGTCDECWFNDEEDTPCNLNKRGICKTGSILKLLPNETRITFENVSSNIICSQITGNKQLLDLTLKITPENADLCDIAYLKTGKLKVTVEWENENRVTV